MDDSLYFHCPGCGILHLYRIKGETQGPMWSWKNNVIEPTFTPSPCW
ncbi:DUF6527 family protein [Escherichia coli]